MDATPPTVAELVELHTGLAVHIARRFSRGRGWLEGELESEAMFALFRAARKHDPEKGDFTSYAGVTIGFAVRGRLAAELKRGPVGERTARGDDGEEVNVLALVADRREAWSPAEVEDLLEVLSPDPDRRATIELRVFDGATFAELGELVGVSGNAAAARVGKALGKLRAALGA